MATAMDLGGQLFEAVQAGDAKRAADLLDRQPDLVNAENASGLRPLTVAMYYGNPQVAELLLTRGAALDVFTASILGRTDRLRSVLTEDPGLVRAYSPDGWTPLHLAAHFGQPEAAALLLDAGAEVEARSRNGMANTPLHAAAAGNQVAVIELLLDHGADVNAQQHGGFTALHAAAQNGDLATVRMLLARGARADLRTDDGKTARDIAAEEGHADVAEALAEE